MRRAFLLLTPAAFSLLAACGGESTPLGKEAFTSTTSSTTAAPAAPGASAGTLRFAATLSGAEEGPKPGDPDGTGTAAVRLDPATRELCYDLTVANLTGVTAAHIHTGAAGATGPPVVPLQAPTTGASSGCVSLSSDIADAIVRSPEAHYVNVHTSEFPDGAVRGQLARS